MTNREHAIKQVSCATKGGDADYLARYAVDTTERVLELESREAELLRSVAAGNETVLDLKARVLKLEDALSDLLTLCSDGAVGKKYLNKARAALPPKGD